MSYTKLDPQLPPRDPTLPYDSIGPGLYPDELAITLDTGELVAVSVERHWQANGSGIAFHGYARWINQDGSTQLAPNEAHVEASISWNADPVTLGAYNEDDLATEVARIVIGDAPQLMRDVPQDDGTTLQLPVIHLSDVGRINASIRHQIKAVTATKSTFIGL